jgi:hypothetical protein
VAFFRRIQKRRRVRVVLRSAQSREELTAMSGALPVIWRDREAFSKERQRGEV